MLFYHVSFTVRRQCGDVVCSNCIAVRSRERRRKLLRTEILHEVLLVAWPFYLPVAKLEKKTNDCGACGRWQALFLPIAIASIQATIFSQITFRYLYNKLLYQLQTIDMRVYPQTNQTGTINSCSGNNFLATFVGNRGSERIPRHVRSSRAHSDTTPTATPDIFGVKLFNSDTSDVDGRRYSRWWPHNRKY